MPLPVQLPFDYAQGAVPVSLLAERSRSQRVAAGVSQNLPRY
ncbi:MAG: hypothetical protein AAGM27_12360 [Cyanobacteria bacterium J06554_3]